MFRLIFNLLRFRRADEQRNEIRRDLRATCEVERAKAGSSRDVFLARDLATLEDKPPQKRK